MRAVLKRLMDHMFRPASKQSLNETLELWWNDLICSPMADEWLQMALKTWIATPVFGCLDRSIQRGEDCTNGGSYR